MRYNKNEKREILKLVEESGLPIKRTLREIGLGKSTYYEWLQRVKRYGYEGLSDKSSKPRKMWNAISDKEKGFVLKMAHKYPDKSPRELAYFIIDQKNRFISESSVYRILKSENLVKNRVFNVLEAYEHYPRPTSHINELWQTDFTYFKIQGWGWYYLSTILDDYSRYIISWELCNSMQATDVMRSVEMAIQVTGVKNISVSQNPKLLSDNGSCYVSSELKHYLKNSKIEHIRGKPYHPMTQGKIERYHRSMKNIIKLNPYFQPSELEHEIRKFVDYYNHKRYHESLNNLCPADVYFGRGSEILSHRLQTKIQTLQERKKNNLVS